MKKLYRNHLWISSPNPNGQSYVGISDFAKNYFLRFTRVEYSEYFKTKYGINNRDAISIFLNLLHDGKPSNLAQQVKWNRFALQPLQPFARLETVEFDVELLAPVTMRVLELQYQTYFHNLTLLTDYMFKVQVLNKEQLSQLMSQQQYLKSKKYIDYI